MRAIVVGGGIGGLCAAVALRRAGIEALVVERAARLEEAGAGLGLTRNALCGLERLSLADVVRARGAAAPRAVGRTWRGDVLTDLPWDGLSIHRADLQAALLEALDPRAVRFAASCTGFVQDAGGVRARLADGSEEPGDVVIGADGLHSAVRAQLFGQREPRYAGTTTWRGVTRFEHEILTAITEWWGRGSRFGLMALGGGRVYWYAAKNAPEGGVVGKRDLLEHFSDWQEPIPAIIVGTDETDILQTDIYDREPLRRWSEGRVTLLGDAAHPMTPDLGQGAAQAIEDAVGVAECLSENDDVARALRRYESRRIGRANAIVRKSRLVHRISQLESPIACHLRNAITKRTPRRLQQRQLERVIGEGP